MKLTAVFEPAKEGGYTCFVEEIPAAISAGRNPGRSEGKPPERAQAGAGVPARTGGKGAVTERPARASRICRGMKLRELERHLRAHGCFAKAMRTRSGSTLPIGRSPVCRDTVKSKKEQPVAFVGSLKSRSCRHFDREFVNPRSYLRCLHPQCFDWNAEPLRGGCAFRKQRNMQW
jgi:hypothetical protein